MGIISAAVHIDNNGRPGSTNRNAGGLERQARINLTVL